MFQVHCATCHRGGDDLGHAVGPELRALGHRSIEDLLSHILDPNMVINAKYATCSVETKSGEISKGVLSAETADQLTLLMPMAQKVTIPRDEIVEFRALDTSLMPEGFEGVLTPAQMRDLIAFLQQ